MSCFLDLRVWNVEVYVYYYSGWVGVSLFLSDIGFEFEGVVYFIGFCLVLKNDDFVREVYYLNVFFRNLGVERWGVVVIEKF